MLDIEPRIEGSASARWWSVAFPDALVKITVNRLDDSPRSLWGEWTIKANFPGLPTPWMKIHHEGFNLLSSAKGRLAKALTVEYPAIPWTSIVDKTAEMVIERHREGEPYIWIDDSPDESLSYRLAPLLLENEPTVIYGLGGKGKSLLTQYLAVLVAEGFVKGSLEPEPGPVLICDYETNQRTVKSHINRLRASLGIEVGSNIAYRRMGQPLASEIEFIQAQVLELGVQLLIVDSAAPAVGTGGAQSDEPVLRYYSALRNLGITTLTVAHRAKNTDNGPFGSVFWENMARNVFRLQSESEGKTRLHLGLFNEKFNDQQRAPFGLRMDFEDDRIAVTEENPKARPEMREYLTIPDQIEAAMKEGKGKPWSVSDLAEETGKPDNQIRSALSRNKGRYNKLPDGNWGLAARE